MNQNNDKVTNSVIYYRYLMEREQQQKYYDSTQSNNGTTMIQLPVIRLRIYANYLSKNNSPAMLLYDRCQFKKQMHLEQSSVIFINHDNSKTKIMSREDLPYSANHMIALDQEGYSLLAEIIIKANGSPPHCFEVRRLADIHFSSQKDLYRNTFVLLQSKSKSKIRKYVLKNKDIIKFGKEIYRATIVMERNDEIKWFDRVYHQKQLSEGTCRICLCQQMSHNEDFLVSPCKCMGTCGFVHIDCLRRWITNQVTIRQKGNVKSYNLKKFSCEVCKCQYPQYISIMGNMIELMPKNFGFQSCLRLEQIEFQQKSKVIHCINLESRNKQVVRIGRSEDNDLMLDDMSISRHHARFVIDRNQIEVEDCDSKFGSYLMLQQALKEVRSVSLMSSRWTFELDFIQK